MPAESLSESRVSDFAVSQSLVPRLREPDGQKTQIPSLWSPRDSREKGETEKMEGGAQWRPGSAEINHSYLVPTGYLDRAY